LSYTLLVQGDSPVGYWKLNGSGAATIGASATVTSPAWTEPPLVSNSASALIIKPSGASVSIYNLYDVFYKNYENKTFEIEFWFSFNGLFDGSGYTKNLSSSTQYFTSNQLNIVQIVNGSTQIGAIYYDYAKNTFRFKINGTDNSEAFIPVRNLNNSFYITAKYTAGNLSIFANGESGVNGYAGDTTSLFPSRASASVNFLINGTSLNSSASMNYVISDLAIYDYQLSLFQKRKRVVNAFYNDKPSVITGYNATSNFDFYERSAHPIHSEYLEGGDFFLRNSDFNLVIDNIYGLAPNIVALLNLSEASDPTSSVVFNNNSASLTGFSSLLFKDFGKIVDQSDTILISAQITAGTASSDYIFAFNDNDTNNIIYSTVRNNGFYVYQYDTANASAAQLLYASTTISSGSTYNFAFSTYNGEYYLYGNGSTASTTGNVINVISDGYLEIANVLSLSQVNSSLSIKNLGISNVAYNNFSSFDFTQNIMYMARLKNDLSVSQVSTWTKNIPISSYGTEIMGSKITWDGMDNCLVEVSANSGSTWSTVTRGSSLSNILYKTVNPDVLVRVTVPFDYQIESAYQSFHDLNVMIYHDTALFSDDMKYSIYAGFEDTTKSSYNIQRNSQNIILRKNHFGIKFDKISGSVNGYAIISPTVSTFSTYATDFWVRFDSLSSPNYLLSSDSSASTTPTLYASASKLINSSGSVYVNGVYRASNTFTLSSGEFYHVFYDFGVPFTGSVMYINGASGVTHSNATYGYLNVWDYSVGASTASVRYKAFVGNNITSITDSVNSSATWQPNWASASVNSASGYKIG